MRRQCRDVFPGSPVRVPPRKFKEVAFDEGIKLSRYRFPGTPTRLVETGSLKPDQSLRNTFPLPPPLCATFFPLPKFARSFINARPMEFPPRTFHLPFQRPSISHWWTLERVMNVSKLRNTAQTFRLISYRFLLNYSEVWDRNIRVKRACVSTFNN